MLDPEEESSPFVHGLKQWSLAGLLLMVLFSPFTLSMNLNFLDTAWPVAPYKVKKVQTGMSRQEVIHIMGNPKYTFFNNRIVYEKFPFSTHIVVRFDEADKFMGMDIDN